jgi:hypothetical protein
MSLVPHISPIMCPLAEINFIPTFLPHQFRIISPQARLRTRGQTDFDLELLHVLDCHKLYQVQN